MEKENIKKLHKEFLKLFKDKDYNEALSKLEDYEQILEKNA